MAAATHENWKGYSLSILLALFAAGVRWLMEPLARDTAHYTLFYPVVAVATAWVGWRAGLVTMGMGVTLGFILFVYLPGRFSLGDPRDFILLGLFLFTSTVVVLLGRWGREQHAKVNTAMNALRSSESRLRTVFEQIPVGLVIAEAPSGRFALWNHRVASILRTQFPEFSSVQDYGRLQGFHPDGRSYRPQDWPLARALLFGEVITNEEVEIERGDATRGFISINAAPIRGEKGEVEAAVAVFGDVTERRRLEAARKENEEHARRIIDSTLAFVAVLDAEGRVLEVNAPALRVSGVSREDVVGRRFGDCYWWAYDPDVQEQIHRTVARAARGEVLRQDILVRIAHEGRLWIDFMLAPLEGGGPQAKYLIASGVDISERKRAEAKLRQSEEKFRTLADNMSQLAWMADPEGNIFWYNKRWFDYTGTNLEQMRGWGWRKVHHPEHVDRVVKKISECFRTGKEWEDTFPLRGQNGDYRWFLARALPVRDAQGNVLRWFGTNTDVTEQEQAEEALRQAQAELRRHATSLEGIVEERTARLRETVAELEHFSYTITHDMRAPLRAMRGYAEILLEECADTLESQPRLHLQRIGQAAERMDNLITDALQYSLLVRGTFDLNPVDCENLLRGILESYPQFQPPQARIDICSRLPVVLANSAGLTQCFSNLLANAVKFVKNGETPEVRIWSEEAAPTRESGPQYVRIVFEDRGIGIDPQHQEKIWEMFQRLNQSYEGTGIGLALVRKAVERMGGRVGVQSQPGQWSRFWLELRSVHQVVRTE